MVTSSLKTLKLCEIYQINLGELYKQNNDKNRK